MRGLAQSGQQVATPQPLECVADALALLGQFYALRNALGDFGCEVAERTRRHCDALRHEVTTEHLQHTAHLVTAEQPTTTALLRGAELVVQFFQFALGIDGARAQLVERCAESLTERRLLFFVGHLTVFQRQLREGAGHLAYLAAGRCGLRTHLADALCVVHDGLVYLRKALAGALQDGLQRIERILRILQLGAVFLVVNDEF